MARLSCVVMLLAFLLLPVGPAEGSSGQAISVGPELSEGCSDFDAFCACVDRTIRRDRDLEKIHRDLGKIYKNKRVTWRLRFKGFPDQGRGAGGEFANVPLVFHIGPATAPRIWFVTLPERQEAWKAVPPGSWVTVRGRITYAGVLRYGDTKQGHFEIEDVEAP